MDDYNRASSSQTSGSPTELPAKFHEFEVASVKPSKSGAAFFRAQFTPDRAVEFLVINHVEQPLEN
jgi:hypothetical protein